MPSRWGAFTFGATISAALITMILSIAKTENVFNAVAWTVVVIAALIFLLEVSRQNTSDGS